MEWVGADRIVLAAEFGGGTWAAHGVFTVPARRRDRLGDALSMAASPRGLVTPRESIATSLLFVWSVPDSRTRRRRR